MIIVNNQIDAQFFMYIYFYSQPVPGSHVPVIMRIIVSMPYLVLSLCVDDPLVCRLTCILEIAPRFHSKGASGVRSVHVINFRYPFHMNPFHHY